MKNTPFLTIILIWLGWFLAVIGFQALATARIQAQLPDHTHTWTVPFTNPKTYQIGHRYLTEPFMNNQVAWDSEYYLGIAIGGYEDPYLPTLANATYGEVIILGNMSPPITDPSKPKPVSLAYAFLPFYPFIIRFFMIPLGIFGLNQIATATLAGVLLSGLGALAGMFALYDLTYESLGKDGALRTVFYLLIFPTGFFLAQVYTEGLFVGLAFSSLAMLKRRNWFLAALLAGCATLTRAVGVALVIPMAITWIRTMEWLDLDTDWRQLYFQNGLKVRPFVTALLAFTPLIVFILWKISYLGVAFDFVETNYFGRGYLDIQNSFYYTILPLKSLVPGFDLRNALSNSSVHQHPQSSAYYVTEFLGLFLGIFATLSVRKKHPELAWFSLAVIIMSWGSGAFQGMVRYVLGAPALFVGLAYWGRNTVFDRIWTIISLLLMALLAMVFAFNMWVA